MPPDAAPPRLRIAVDIGGTFTDLVGFDETAGELRFGKALSTHDGLVRGIENALDAASVRVADAHLFLHGSTIAINTLLERTGARTALLITEGFRDIYEIGRVNRPDAYNLFFRKHVPLVPRADRHEVHERLLASGTVHTPLDEDHLRGVLRGLRGVESVAILLLHSYRNPAHEMCVKQMVAEEWPGVFVTASHELSQEYREFERVSTVAANAYVGSRVAAYLGELSDHLARHGFTGDFFVVQSTSGMFPVEHARRDCVRMLESEPAPGGDTLGGALLLVVLGCIVMGMGLPTVAAYIIGAILFVPALQHFGVSPIAAHFFVMYYCVLSMVTPPVALASYATAGLAGAGAMKTSLVAFRMSFVCFLTPLAFLADSALLAQGSIAEVLVACAGLLLSTAIWAAGVVGYSTRTLSLPERAILLACGVAAILAPTGSAFWLAGNGAALLMLGVVWRFPHIVLGRPQPVRAR